MMKWRLFFQKLFIAHIAAFEEQLNSDRPHRPVGNTTVIRSSIKRYFKYAGAGPVYVLAYDPVYEEAIGELRKDGWVICMELDSSGELCYGIYDNTEKTLSSPRF